MHNLLAWQPNPSAMIPIQLSESDSAEMEAVVPGLAGRPGGQELL